MNVHIKSLVDFDARHEMFYKATRFIDYELVEGDIVEFGVYTGRSLVLLSHYHEEFKKTIHGYKIQFEYQNIIDNLYHLQCCKTFQLLQLKKFHLII